VEDRIAINLLLKGDMTREEVAKAVGMTQRAVSRWWARYRKGGADGLRRRKHTGRPPALNEEQRRELVEVLVRGAESCGFETDIWTTERIARVIYERFGIRYHPDHVRKILHSLGLSWKRVEGRARERNEGAVKRWIADALPDIKKLTETGGTLVLVDEAGFSPTPPMPNTWAMKGTTPRMKFNFDRKKLSAIGTGGITPSPGSYTSRCTTARWGARRSPSSSTSSSS
jgi:transposase